MNTPHQDDFDRRMRALHARAVDQVPARALYELKVRRENAMKAPARPARRTGWGRPRAATPCRRSPR